MSVIRCAKCDTVFEARNDYDLTIQTLGHPECPNAACNPKLAAVLAEQRAKEAQEAAEYAAWKAERAAAQH